jgi:hypothetical protein
MTMTAAAAAPGMQATRTFFWILIQLRPSAHLASTMRRTPSMQGSRSARCLTPWSTTGASAADMEHPTAARSLASYHRHVKLNCVFPAPFHSHRITQACTDTVSMHALVPKTGCLLYKDPVTFKYLVYCQRACLKFAFRVATEGAQRSANTAHHNLMVGHGTPLGLAGSSTRRRCNTPGSIPGVCGLP